MAYFFPIAIGLIVLGVAVGQGKFAVMGLVMLAAPFMLAPIFGIVGSTRIIREFPAEWRRSSMQRRIVLAILGGVLGIGLVLLALAVGALVLHYT